MKQRTEYWLLVLLGVVLMLAAGFIQFSSMDLQTYELKEYLGRDLNQGVWWSAIGMPFIFGAGYLCLGVLGLRGKLSKAANSWEIFALCFVAACALASVSGFGIFAAIVSAVCLAIAKFRKY